MLPVTVLVLCFFVFFLAHKFTHARHYRGALPPGPRGLPLLGNALQIPLTYSWLAFTRWAQTYGEHDSSWPRPGLPLWCLR